MRGKAVPQARRLRVCAPLLHAVLCPKLHVGRDCSGEMGVEFHQENQIVVHAIANALYRFVPTYGGLSRLWMLYGLGDRT